MDIDPALLDKAQRMAAQAGKPFSEVVEASLKLYLDRERPLLQAPPGNCPGGSLDREDPFLAILSQIEEERHARTPPEPVRFE